MGGGCQEPGHVNFWKNVEDLSTLARKAIECCKQSSVVCSSKSLEDKRAERFRDGRGPAQEISDGNTSNRL